MIRLRGATVVGAFATIAAAVGATLAVAAAQRPVDKPSARTWAMTDLGTLGGKFSVATAINNRGQIVGTSRNSKGERRYFLWQDGKMTDLGKAPRDYGGTLLLNERGQVVAGSTLWDRGVATQLDFSPRAINDRGQIVGLSRPPGRIHAVLWVHGRVREIVPPRYHVFEVSAVNDRGVVVGVSVGRGPSLAFWWKDGKSHALPALAGLARCQARDINSTSQMLGHCSRDVPFRLHTVIWHDGGIRDVGVLDDASWVYPESLNDAGQVLGRTRVGGREHEFLWSRGTFTDLGPVTYPHTGPAFNNHGVVVGVAARHAVVWQNGHRVRLGRSGRLSNSAALAINDENEIVGYSQTGEPGEGTSYSAPRHAVLWTPKP